MKKKPRLNLFVSLITKTEKYVKSSIIMTLATLKHTAEIIKSRMDPN